MAIARRPSSLLLLLLAAVLLVISGVAASDTLYPGQPLTANQSLVSVGGGYFRLGFFSPGNGTRRYLAIWYNLIPVQTTVWVANRERALPASGGSLALTSTGKLVVSDTAGVVYWSSSGTAGGSGRPAAKLMENGNLVVQDGNGGTVWQSFDYPSDSVLPDMKIGEDHQSGLRRVATSWLGPDDPAPGNYSFLLHVHGVPQTLLTSSGATRWRSGPWTGERFNGVPAMSSYNVYTLSFSYVSDENETSYSFHIADRAAVVSYLRVAANGHLQRLIWVSRTSSWNPIWYAPNDQCDDVSPCGPFGLCNAGQTLACSCLQGFTPRSPEDWYLRDGKDGCVRLTPLDCRNGTDGFAAVAGIKLPDTSNATVDYRMVLDDCRRACLDDCRCTAYAAANVSGGVLSGCIRWTGDLTDLRVYAANDRQDLFLRLAAKDLVSTSNASSKRRIWVPILICTLVAVILTGGCLLWRKRRWAQVVVLNGDTNTNDNYNEERDVGREVDLPLFDFSTIELSTDYFSINNKLGEGGFGLVYKGRLEDKQVVAVKRLGRNSLQGIDEFTNEVRLIAKLQHRNLVRLLGCCIHGEERMLIYEYMANGSLDSFLFKKTKNDCLDWDTRHQIIMGVARGLLYLHQDSRFRIIHRDLKAGNILLDAEMNPKISDFGMARIFGGDETGLNTRRIVGTYGYMSPEYAMDGVFSVKSDVFSFGVLVLEIISGRRNRATFSVGPLNNLLGHTWSLWSQDKSIEIAEKSILNPNSVHKILKCISIALLCVQKSPDDRPTMSSVVLMLGSDDVTLPQPSEPGFAMRRGPIDTSSSARQESCTVNNITITTLEGR